MTKTPTKSTSGLVPIVGSLRETGEFAFISKLASLFDGEANERKMRIRWLNYYAKSLLEREGVGYLDVGGPIEVRVKEVKEGIRINFNKKSYLLSETQLTRLDIKTYSREIRSSIFDEMMERGRLQELSKAATHFSTLSRSRLSKKYENEKPRLGKTEIFDNFEYHTELLNNIAAARDTEQLIQVINRAIVKIGSPETYVETMIPEQLAEEIRKIENRNPVVLALKGIRRELNESKIEDKNFEEYKTTFVTPYTENHLVVTIEGRSAIVHIITHAEISKLTIDLSGLTIEEEQKSSIINFIGNQIRGADTTTNLDEDLKVYLKTQIAKKLRNPRRELTEIKLEHDPILESLEKDFAALEKDTRKLQRIVRDGLLRKVQTQEAKLKAAFERAAADIFGNIDEPEDAEEAESYEGLKIFRKDGKLEVKQPPEMRNAYKELLESNPANSDRVSIFEESEALRTEPGKFSFVGNRLFLETINEGSRGNSDTRKDKFRILKKHELEDELEILKIFLETQRAKESEKFLAALKDFCTPGSDEEENTELKQEYLGVVTLGNGKIKLIQTTDGVPSVEFKFNSANNIAQVSVEENGKVTELSSTIHNLQKATEALGKIKAAVQKQKIRDLFKMARVLSPYGEIVIDREGNTEELSLTSERTDDTTYSVNIGDQIYCISEEVLLDNEKEIVKEPRIIEELKTYLEAARIEVIRAQAEFRTVVESVFSANTKTADYSHSNYEIKPFRKIGATTDEDEVSFEATLPISRDTLQSYYFKLGGVVRSGNDDEAPPVKFAELVSQKRVAEDFIEAEKAARLGAINKMAESFKTKLEKTTGLEILETDDNYTVTFVNAKNFKFVFRNRETLQTFIHAFDQTDGNPQPFLTTNGSESTLHDLQLAQERLDEIDRENAVITQEREIISRLVADNDLKITAEANGVEFTKNPTSVKFKHVGDAGDLEFHFTSEGKLLTDPHDTEDLSKKEYYEAKLQQHIEEIKEKEAANRKRRSCTTGFKTTFHAVAPKTVALAELAKVSQDEIPQNKLMHALDKLLETYVLIPTEKSKKFDKADKSTLVKHSLEILQKNSETNPDEIKRLSGYQPKSHNRQLNEDLEEEAIAILRNYYTTQKSEKLSMITKIKNFAKTQPSFARSIHDETSTLKPTGTLNPKYAQLLAEHKERTSGSKGGGGQG